jgi:histidinol-phosphate aminotransferase
MLGTSQVIYRKPPERYDGLRLHQNENTAGCSPKVVEALQGLTARTIACYPPCQEVALLCASHFGVGGDFIAPTHGLEEGILALAMTQLRNPTRNGMSEAIIPKPGFEKFAIDTIAAGGQVVDVPCDSGFTFSLKDVLAAITSNTRLVFLASPNNPTGISTPFATVRAIAESIPSDAVVFLDEAYAEFAGVTFIPEITSYPNVVVGRTFSKAFGLAGLRIGCLIGSPDILHRVSRALPLYPVSVAAAVALKAALNDREYVEHYVHEVRQSKKLLYDACDRMGIRYWLSDANFVLIWLGEQADAFVDFAASRALYVRSQSASPNCVGCVRVSVGLLDHTRQLVETIIAYLKESPSGKAIPALSVPAKDTESSSIGYRNGSNG